MATDANVTLVTSGSPTTATATHNGTGFTLGNTVYDKALWLQFNYSAASSDSTNAALFSVDVSFDGGSAWINCGTAGASLALTTTVAAGQVTVPFMINRNDLLQSTHAPKIRDTVTITGAGSSPSITYYCALAPSYGG